MSKIMGVDPSLTATGFYVLDTDILTNNIYGEIKSNEKGIKRLLEIEEKIEDELFIKIDLVVMERYIYFPTSGASIGNIELGAILKRLFYKQEIPLILVAPTTLKKFITGSGKSPKNEILKRAYQKWNIDLGEHITEAFALAKIGEMITKKDDKQYVDGLKQYEREVLEVFRNLLFYSG